MCAGNEYEKPTVFIEQSDVNYKILSSANDKLKGDMLAKLTYYTKLMLLHLRHVCAIIEKYYRVFRGTTQPAHLITMLSVILIAKLLQSTTISDNNGPPSSNASSSGIIKLMYMGSFATHLGTQIWMTFVSGLSLYFALPRHMFGAVQKILFPKYFSMNAMLSLITLMSFMQCSVSTVDHLQTMNLVVCFLIELTIRLYMTPPLLHLITEKNKLEIAAGIGMEVGEHTPSDDLIRCPKYMQLHTSFRKVHMTIAIGNLITMACTTIHLFYLSTRICI